MKVVIGCSSVSCKLLFAAINVLVFPDVEIICNRNDEPDLTSFHETCAEEDVTSVIVICSEAYNLMQKSE
ncbi:MAG: hypothetical protein IPJ93_03290 [Bacteroidota bacterium]|nr:MAG: hypothetical protein IPJ93_03290 [Bacteroidota bacterium]